MNTFPAKFTSKCQTCQTTVAKGTGHVHKGVNGKWVVRCETCHLIAAAPGVRQTDVVRTCGCGAETTFAVERTGCTGATLGWDGICSACAAERGRPFAQPARPARRVATDRTVKMVNRADGSVAWVAEADVHDAQKDGFRVA
jgi:hypothetical protein